MHVRLGPIVHGPKQATKDRPHGCLRVSWAHATVLAGVGIVVILLASSAGAQTSTTSSITLSTPAAAKGKGTAVTYEQVQDSESKTLVVAQQGTTHFYVSDTKSGLVLIIGPRMSFECNATRCVKAPTDAATLRAGQAFTDQFFDMTGPAGIVGSIYKDQTTTPDQTIAGIPSTCTTGTAYGLTTNWCIAKKGGFATSMSNSDGTNTVTAMKVAVPTAALWRPPKLPTTQAPLNSLDASTPTG
jgi:hypothetical protein